MRNSTGNGVQEGMNLGIGSAGVFTGLSGIASIKSQDTHFLEFRIFTQILKNSPPASRKHDRPPPISSIAKGARTFDPSPPVAEDFLIIYQVVENGLPYGNPPRNSRNVPKMERDQHPLLSRPVAQQCLPNLP